MKCQVLFSQLLILFTWSLTLTYSVFNKVKLVVQKAKIFCVVGSSVVKLTSVCDIVGNIWLSVDNLFK